jgi:uncharacterized protein (DUF1697 family)
MPVYIALLRGINVGGRNLIRMEAFRSLCGSLGLGGVETYIQSGNAVFRDAAKAPAKLAARIETALESEFGFRPSVILRTTAQWKAAIARNPFAGRSGIEPARLLLYVLASDPGEEAREKVRALPASPEELHILGNELYIYYPHGMARPTLSLPAVERALRTPASGRNWNTVLKLLEMAERLEAGG